MQQEILNYVPTIHLLRHCRIVSKSWNDQASSACRSRQVLIQGQKFYDEPAALGTRFKNPANLPWSSINLLLCSGDKSESIINEEMSRKYGYQVQKLHVVVEHHNYGNLFLMLSQMPNLKVLTFDSIELSNKPSEAGVFEQFLRIFEAHCPICLPNLKTLETKWMTTDFPKFVEFIITKSGAKLAKLNLQLTGFPGKDLKNLLSLLSNADIKYTTMKLMFTQFTIHPFFTSQSIWKLFAAQQIINVQELDIYLLVNNRHIAPSELRILELALSKFKNLVKLILTGFFSTTQLTTTQMVRIPAIKTLKMLTILCNSGVENDRPQNPPRARQNLFVQIHSISSSDFPTLNTIQLTKKSSISNDNIIFRNLFDPNSKFEFVEILDTCQYTGSENWADLFPNLRILVATVRVAEDIQNIFKCKNLESVVIIMKTELDHNLVLSQSFQPLPACKKLLSLSLKFFQENFDTKAQIKITDSAALLLFKFLPPLQLTLVNAMITEDADSQLRSHHKDFKIHQDIKTVALFSLAVE